MRLQLFLFLSTLTFSAASAFDSPLDQKIAIQNSILTKVNGKTISMMDVKKKMDIILHQHDPRLTESSLARYQFYEMHWKQVFMELIDHELILSDAIDKELKLTDGEIREEMERRFGPSVMQTLDKIGLTYDETWKMVKDEMMVQRMSWWFVQAKADSNVTPQDIRQAYRLYLKENPPYSEWTYRVLSIRSDTDNEALAEKIYDILQSSRNPPDLFKERLKEFETPEIFISLSNEYKAKTHDLSEIHKASLESLSVGSYSKPSFQISRADKKSVYRIFYLIEKVDVPAPTFEQISPQLRNELVQKQILKESESYISKLRKHYGFDPKELISKDLHPFSLQ